MLLQDMYLQNNNDFVERYSGGDSYRFIVILFSMIIGMIEHEVKII